MKFISYQLDNQTGFGILRGEHEIVPLNDLAKNMVDFISQGADAIAKAQAKLAQTLVTLSTEDVVLLAPIPNPARNIQCIGKNYAAHAKESHDARGEQHEIAAYPIVFTKATTTINGPYADIPYDSAVSDQIDYEAELAIVIGKAGKNISREDAHDYIFGYTIVNDISARDLQFNHKQYFRGKSLDGACPMGPWIISAEALPNPQSLTVRCEVNGEERQNGNTNDMIFDIPEIIAQLSKGSTLLPGDIIATGTPEGVGFARKPPVFLQPGDIVECFVESIGSIRNRIATE